MVADAGLRVWVVEDDAFTRMTLTTVVVSLGYEVDDQAGTVVEAMDAARKSRPGVVLIDLDLGAEPTGIDAAYGLPELLGDAVVDAVPRTVRSEMTAFIVLPKRP